MNLRYKICTTTESTFIQHLKRRQRQPNKQHGVVLFVALIALVVMSLAAVALIRSVDTNTIIAGNLASKQSATVSADAGLETALEWLATSPATLEADNSANAALGYYATQAKPPTTFNWVATDSRVATDASGNIDANGTDRSGNTIRYVIQRMCRSAGAPTAGNCLFVTVDGGGNSNHVVDATEAAAGVSAAATDVNGDGVIDALDIPGGSGAGGVQSPVYRVTARVTGTKNTVSYVQAFVY